MRETITSSTSISISTELANYTAIDYKLEAFRAAHAGILGEWDEIQLELRLAEGRLKDRAREHGAEENDLFVVTVTYPKHRWYDVDLILEKAPYVKEIPGVMITTVDKDKVTALAKNGMLAQDVIEAAYREEAKTPAVTIKRR